MFPIPFDDVEKTYRVPLRKTTESIRRKLRPDPCGEPGSAAITFDRPRYAFSNSNRNSVISIYGHALPPCFSLRNPLSNQSGCLSFNTRHSLFKMDCCAYVNRLSHRANVDAYVLGIGRRPPFLDIYDGSPYFIGRRCNCYRFCELKHAAFPLPLEMANVRLYRRALLLRASEYKPLLACISRLSLCPSIFSSPRKNAADRGRTRVLRMWAPRGHNVETIAGQLIEPFLVGARPRLVPGRVNPCDELVSIDMVVPGVGKHRAKECYVLRIRLPRLSTFACHYCHHLTIGRKH